jgi:hypothetical protein
VGIPNKILTLFWAREGNNCWVITVFDDGAWGPGTGGGVERMMGPGAYISLELLTCSLRPSKGPVVGPKGILAPIVKGGRSNHRSSNRLWNESTGRVSVDAAEQRFPSQGRMYDHASEEH